MIGRMRSLGAFVSSIVGAVAGVVGVDLDAKPKRVNVPQLRARERVVSAYCGRYGGSARARRAVRNAIRNAPNGYRASEVLEATRRGVAYDNRRVRNRAPMLTSTGLPTR